MRYRNFDIEATGYVRDNGVERFKVRVLRSPAGIMDARAAMDVAIDDALRGELEQFQRRVLQFADFARLGQELGARLFPAPVRNLFQMSLAEANGADEGIRIRLRFESPELAGYPWEYVYLSEEGDGDLPTVARFLSLNRKLSIVRCQSLPDESVKLAPVAEDALDMCAVFASPTGDDQYLPLDVDQEQRVISQALNGVTRVRLHPFSEADSAQLDKALELNPHLLHFAGHGDFDPAGGGRGCLILRGADGRGAALDADLFAARMRGRRTRLVMLGACFGGTRGARTPWTGVASALLGVDVPAVVAMQADVNDDSAICFSRRLYSALAEGKPLDAAVVDGRLEIVNQLGRDERDFGVPVVYLDAHDGAVFPRRSTVESADEDETWNRLVDASRAQVARQLSKYRGTPATPGVYLADCFLERGRVQAAFDAFLTGDARVMMVVDEGGMGKTSTLCRWAERLSREGHLVFFYSADSALHNGIFHDLCNDLALRHADEVEQTLDRAEALARSRNRQLFLIVDSVNDYRGRQEQGASELLFELDALATRAAWPALRLLAACSTSTWNRLSREGVLQRLTKDRYYASEGGKPVLQLGPLSGDEAADAYTAYARVFRLAMPYEALSPNLRARLRRPLLLRMLAEAYAGKPGPMAANDVTLDLFERFVRQRLTSSNDAQLAERLATKMWEQRRIALPVDEALQDPTLGIEVPRDGRPAPWITLQERDLLRVQSGDPLVGDTVQFVFPALGAFFLARAFLREGAIGPETITTLITEARVFPFAWGAARWCLLLTQEDGALYTTLAASRVAEVRELVSDALVELHDVNATRARATMQSLLRAENSDARYVALKSAFFIGAGARDLLLDAAGDRSEAVRDDVRDVLYLIWHNEETEVRRPTDDALLALWQERPGFAVAFLDDLLNRITLVEAVKGAIGRGELLAFFLTITMAIYINHCDRPDVIDKTVEWYRKLAKERLRLDLFDKTPGIIRDTLPRLVMNALYRKYGEQIIDALRLRGVEEGRDPFVASPAERQMAHRVIPALDPAAPLAAHTDDLAAMLASDVPAFRILASIPIAVHACADPAGAEPVVRELREGAKARERMQLLLAFAVLARNTPDEWIPWMEAWTEELVTRDRSVFDGVEPSLLRVVDIAFLPLGLALGKRGRPLDRVQRLLRQAIDAGDEALSARIVRALGSPGYYYPHPVLTLLASFAADLRDGTRRDAMEQTLGLIRVTHRSEVDTFILDQSLGDDASRRILTMADPLLLRRLIWYVGLYSHGVYCAWRYPRMRTGIAAPAFELIATAANAQEFALESSMHARSLFRQSGYDLREWMRPEPWP
ncbi:MAG: CHAT domain-containing protein [Gemmatimonadaceae bacterium]